MNKNYYIWIGAAALFFQACATDKVICDGRVFIESPGTIRFSKNEKQLLCGDQNIDEWKNVPLAQTETTIREFLKGRGYFNTKFALEGEQLQVDTGRQFSVKEVKFINAPSDFDKVKYIGWKGKTFTPGTLDEIEGYTLRRLKELGYACSEVKIQAIIESQVVQVHINHGDKYLFPEVEYDEDVKMKPEVLERYFAFHPGDPYNENLLALSSRRIETDAVVSKSNFLPECNDGKLSIKHRINTGTSRLVQIG
ncbi:MAG: hypothetical protein IT286_03595, partial [Proteobacteria bacterium]|nr:hypothetical protein [Pseudomonadota bacterium]